MCLLPVDDMSDPNEQSGAGGAKSFLTAKNILKTKLYSKALKRTATQAPHPSETMAPGGRPLPRPAAGSSLGAWGALPLQHTSGAEQGRSAAPRAWGARGGQGLVAGQVYQGRMVPVATNHPGRPRGPVHAVTLAPCPPSCGSGHHPWPGPSSRTSSVLQSSRGK